MEIIKYPKLQIKAYQNDEEQLSSLALSGQFYIIKTYLQTDANTIVLIEPNDTNLFVKCFDNNGHIRQQTVESTLQNVLYVKSEGTLIVKSFYIVNGESISVAKEFVIYGDFFKNNYLDIMSEYDAQNIQRNPYATIFFETCMEFVDILYAYNKDISSLRDPINIKYKFINLLGNSLGLSAIQQTDGTTKQEYTFVRLYRELLSNLFELLNIRGSKLSYELFFGALGYDIDLLEYWFNEDGNLVEINPYNEAASTFALSDISGIPLGDQSIIHDDPRTYTSVNNVYNYCNKSPYVKPVLKYKDNFSDLVNYSYAQRKVVREYLEFLRPWHIKYLDDVITIGLPQDNADVCLWNISQNDYLNRTHNDPDYFLESFKPCDLFYYSIPLEDNITDETIRQVTEKLIISMPLKFNDALTYFSTYDTQLYYDGYVYNKQSGMVTPEKPEDLTIPPEHWNDSNWTGEQTYGRPTSNNLYYDLGTTLEELSPKVLNLTVFATQYEALYKLNYSEELIKSTLMQLFDITEFQYSTAKNL